MTISQVRVELARELSFTGEGDAEAAEIISRLEGLSYSGLVLSGGAEFSGGKMLGEIIEKRRAGMPLAYALNVKCFYGLDFYVNPSVLIPRADSECVAQEAVRIANARGARRLLDLCCGSGCLGVTAANGCGAEFTAFADISGGALKVAKINAGNLLNSGRAVFYESDLFKSISGKFDLIICNPPYISAAEYQVLEPQVKCYEPEAALLAGARGTEFYRRICRGARQHINPGGVIVFEIGCGQSRAVSDIMRAAGMRVINAGRDLADRPRFVTGEFYER